MLSSDNKAHEFKRGKSNVVMFVGLQGAGKTTTCTKFAYHYMKKGWKVGVVCADTFRAGAFTQLQMNAAKIKCPFYGNKNETDPVKIAEAGVAYFRQNKYEIIIVDTSGRHRQENALFEEMIQVQETIKPDSGIFVMDGSIGQACFAQAKAFKDAIRVGSVIITKLDGHAKGGGSLSAVAATESPIVFLGTGEHFEDLEAFDPNSFVRRLLGMGDMAGLMRTVNEAMSGDQQKHIIDQIKQGKFSLRDMRDQFSSVLNMGSLSNVVGMIPGFNANMIPKGQEKESTDRIKKFLYMMDSMTDKELDGVEKINQTRALRIAQGAGANPRELLFLLGEHKRFSTMVERMGKMTQGLEDPSMMKRDPKRMMSQLQNAIDPGMLQQMGGMGNLMNMVGQMQNGEGGEGMGQMMEQVQKMMGGGGMPGMPGMPGGGGRGGRGGGRGAAGGGGMPDMAAMMQAMQGMGGAGGEGGGMGGMMDMAKMMMGGGGAGGMKMPPGMPKGMMRMGKR